jgi:hypothetical protein
MAMMQTGFLALLVLASAMAVGERESVTRRDIELRLRE